MFGGCYQGGDAVEVLGCSGRAPLALWRLSHVAAAKMTYQSDLKGYVHCLNAGPHTSLSLPKHKSHKLGLCQPVLVLQIRLPPADGICSFEVTVHDSLGSARRLAFSTCLERPSTTPLLSRLPLSTLPRMTWINLAIDVSALVRSLFHVEFASIEGICLRPQCAIRRIFTMRACPASMDDKLVDASNTVVGVSIPYGLDFPPGVSMETRLLSPESFFLSTTTPGVASLRATKRRPRTPPSSRRSLQMSVRPSSAAAAPCVSAKRLSPTRRPSKQDHPCAAASVKNTLARDRKRKSNSRTELATTRNPAPGVLPSVRRVSSKLASSSRWNEKLAVSTTPDAPCSPVLVSSQTADEFGTDSLNGIDSECALDPASSLITRRNLSCDSLVDYVSLEDAVSSSPTNRNDSSVASIKNEVIEEPSPKPIMGPEEFGDHEQNFDSDEQEPKGDHDDVVLMGNMSDSSPPIRQFDKASPSSMSPLHSDPPSAIMSSESSYQRDLSQPSPHWTSDDDELSFVRDALNYYRVDDRGPVSTRSGSCPRACSTRTSVESFDARGLVTLESDKATSRVIRPVRHVRRRKQFDRERGTASSCSTSTSTSVSGRLGPRCHQDHDDQHPHHRRHQRCQSHGKEGMRSHCNEGQAVLAAAAKALEPRRGSANAHNHVDLMYDPILKLYFDPRTNKYFEVR